MEWYMNLYDKEDNKIRRIKGSSVGQLINWIDYYESRPDGLSRFTAWANKEFAPDIFPPEEVFCKHGKLIAKEHCELCMQEDLKYDPNTLQSIGRDDVP